MELPYDPSVDPDPGYPVTGAPAEPISGGLISSSPALLAVVVIGPLESIKGGSISTSGGLLSSTPSDGVVGAGVTGLGVAAPVDPLPEGG